MTTTHLAILLFSFLAAIDVTILATIMPQLIASLGEMQLYPMLGASYLVAFFITTPIFGKVADHFGSQKAAIIALAVFLLGSCGAGFSVTMQQLIFSRLLQGAGAAGLVNISNIMIGRLYRNDARRSLMQALLVSSVWAFASIVGPLFAAFITANFSWRFVFFVNVPIVFIAMFCMSRYREVIEKTHDRFDIKGTFLFVVGSFLFFFSTLKATSGGLGAMRLVLMAIATVMCALFVRRCLRVPSPLVPFKLLKEPEIAICIVFGMISGACLVSTSSLVSLYIQGALRKSLQETGFVITATSVGWTCGSFFAGFLLRYADLTKLAAISLLALISGLFMLSEVTLHVGISYFVISNLILGFGLGSMVNFTITGVQRAAAHKLLGRATSFLSLMRALAGSIGAAIAGYLQLFFFRGSLQGAEGISPEIVSSLTQYPEKFLDQAIQKGVSGDEFSLLTSLFASSIQSVFIIPVIILIVISPLILFFSSKKIKNVIQ